MGVTLGMINWKRVELWERLISLLYFLSLWKTLKIIINFYLSTVALLETFTNLESVPDLEIKDTLESLKLKYGL